MLPLASLVLTFNEISSPKTTFFSGEILILLKGLRERFEEVFEQDKKVINVKINSIIGKNNFFIVRIINCIPDCLKNKNKLFRNNSLSVKR